MSKTNKELIQIAKDFSNEVMARDMNPTVYHYHNVHHVKAMRDAAKDLASDYNLSDDDKTDLEIACWLHDVGYKEGSEGHESRSAAKVDEIYSQDDMDQSRKARIKNIIMATHMDSNPEVLVEKIIKDADMHHIGTKAYLAKTGMLKDELQQVSGEEIKEKDWVKQNLKFLHEHEFQTPVAEAKYNRRKRKNILKVQKHLRQLQEFENNVLDLNLDKENVAIELAANRADRGIETMYRVTLRNHNNLSVIADNKANIMLSINAIMLSIVLSSLAPKMDTNPKLIMPTIVLTLVCVITVLLAILATRPKISTAPYSDEAFLNKKFNLLFFGNFFKLPIEKFEWGMNTLMNNEDMLYSSLSKDLYYLGAVLARKYRILWICYNVFAIGIVLAVVAFIWAFTTMEAPGVNILE